MPKFYRPLLLSTVFTTGAAVLIFEVAAVRALTPYFGASMYVVSSVLTVILAALSLGYYIGGRLADRYPAVRFLYVLIGMAGLIMNVLYLFSQVIFPFAGGVLSIVYGPLILSAIFFFIPAFLLGIDSPFVIKLLTSAGDDAHNGAVVGSTFFWSTMGSIVGSLASGFFLIPFFGVQLTFVGTATILSLFSCIAFLALSPYVKDEAVVIKSNAILIVTAMSVLVAAIGMKVEAASLHAGELLHRSDGYYSQIEVREVWAGPLKTVRTLHREVNNSSAITLGSTEFLFPYAEYARAYRALREDTHDYLLIGGGAYVIPRTLLAEDENLYIDVVEIEPRLFTIAQTYFELPQSERLTNYAMDGRYFLRTHDKQYDAVFLDAYQSGNYIPPHLVTQEFYVEVASHMVDGGVLMINLLGEVGNPDTTSTGSIIKTIRSVFPNLSVYATRQAVDERVNLVLIARRGNYSSVLPQSFVINYTNGTSSRASEWIVPLGQFYLEQQKILTDDLSPIEFLVAEQSMRLGI